MAESDDEGVTDETPNYEACNAIDANTADFEFTDANNELISTNLMSYGEEPAEKDSPEYKSEHTNKLLNALNFVANLTNNTILQVGLCIDHDTVKNYDLPKKRWELPPCQVNSGYTLQGTLTKFAKKRYGQWVPQRKASLIKKLVEGQKGKSKKSQKTMKEICDSIDAIRFPVWDGKTNMQNDYGAACRHLQHYWYLHKSLPRQMAFDACIAELKKDCTSRDCPKKIIKKHLEARQQGHCNTELLKCLDETEMVKFGGKDEKVVKNNDLLAERLETFFLLYKVKYTKAMFPDPLYCFQAYLTLEATPLIIKTAFTEFGALSAVRNDHFDNWVAAAKAKQQKEEDAQKRKVEAEKRKRKTKVDAEQKKKTKQNEKEYLKYQTELAQKEIRKKLGIKEKVAVKKKGAASPKEGAASRKEGDASKSDVALVDGQRPRMIGKWLDMPPVDVPEDEPPMMKFQVNAEGTFYHAKTDGTAWFVKPGKNWKLKTTKSYRLIFILIDILTMELDFPLDAFVVEDKERLGNLCDYSSQVIAAIWNVNMLKTPIVTQLAADYDQDLFLQYVDESHESWLQSGQEARVQQYFVAFYDFVIGDGGSHYKKVLDTVCNITKDGNHMMKDDGKHLRHIMVELFKVRSFIDGDSTTWAETNALGKDEAVPECVMEGLTTKPVA